MFGNKKNTLYFSDVGYQLQHLIQCFTKVCAKTIVTLCKIPWFLSLTWIYRYELTGGDSDNYKDIFQTVSISITKIYNRKKYRWNFADFWIANIHTKKIIPVCSWFLAETKYVSYVLIWQNEEPHVAKICQWLTKFFFRNKQPVFATIKDYLFSSRFLQRQSKKLNRHCLIIPMT